MLPDTATAGGSPVSTKPDLDRCRWGRTSITPRPSTDRERPSRRHPRRRRSHRTLPRQRRRKPCRRSRPRSVSAGVLTSITRRPASAAAAYANPSAAATRSTSSRRVDEAHLGRRGWGAHVDHAEPLKTASDEGVLSRHGDIEGAACRDADSDLDGRRRRHYVEHHANRSSTVAHPTSSPSCRRGVETPRHRRPVTGRSTTPTSNGVDGVDDVDHSETRVVIRLATYA